MGFGIVAGDRPCNHSSGDTTTILLFVVAHISITLYQHRSERTSSARLDTLRFQTQMVVMCAENGVVHALAKNKVVSPYKKNSEVHIFVLGVSQRSLVSLQWRLITFMFGGRR